MKYHKLLDPIGIIILIGMGLACKPIQHPAQSPLVDSPVEPLLIIETTEVPPLQDVEPIETLVVIEPNEILSTSQLTKGEPSPTAEIAPIAVFPLPEPATIILPTEVSGAYRVSATTIINATLYSGEVYKYTLGPCSTDGGYLVDVSPLSGSTDGAHIEQQILPEFDGKMWVDVLSLTLPEQTEPLPVRLELAATVGWPVVYQQTFTLNPGEMTGFVIQESKAGAGYVIEINPHSDGEFGDRVEKALVQPEFYSATWWDVLRLQVPAAQPPLTADMIVYQTPVEAQVVTSYELEAEPGIWSGVALGASEAHAVYIVRVTPLINADNQVERYTVQPEFNGHTWNDVVRVSIPSNRPPTTLQVTVYRIALGDG